MSLFKIEFDRNRIFGLDIMRAMAILYVVISHGQYLVPVESSISVSWFIFDGVSIFFVLSGYLIGGILIRSVYKKPFTPKLLANFWVRRWFRTLPNYYLVVTLVLLFEFLQYGSLQPGYPYYKFYLFIQNFNFHKMGFFPEGWSLSVEEWFYIFFPVLLFVSYWLSRKNLKRSIIITSVLLILFATGMRLYYYNTLPYIDLFFWDVHLRKLVITRMDSLMFGVLAAYFHFYFPKQWQAYRLPTFVIGVVLFLFFKIAGIIDLYRVDSFMNVVLSFTCMSVATALLIPFLSSIKEGSGIVYRGITKISLISYSMYLLNLNVIQYNIIKWFPWSDNPEKLVSIYALNYVIYWILVLGLSTLLYKYFELPMMRLRDLPFIKKLNR